MSFGSCTCTISLQNKWHLGKGQRSFVFAFISLLFKMNHDISYFDLDSNELRRKLAKGEEEHAEKIREFNEEVQVLHKQYYQ